MYAPCGLDGSSNWMMSVNFINIYIRFIRYTISCQVLVPVIYGTITLSISLAISRYNVDYKGGHDVVKSFLMNVDCEFTFVDRATIFITADEIERYHTTLNWLASGWCGNNCNSVVSEHIVQIKFMSIFLELFSGEWHRKDLLTS